MAYQSGERGYQNPYRQSTNSLRGVLDEQSPPSVGYSAPDYGAPTSAFPNSPLRSEYQPEYAQTDSGGGINGEAVGAGISTAIGIGSRVASGVLNNRELDRANAEAMRLDDAERNREMQQMGLKFQMAGASAENDAARTQQRTKELDLMLQIEKASNNIKMIMKKLTISQDASSQVQAYIDENPAYAEYLRQLSSGEAQ